MGGSNKLQEFQIRSLLWYDELRRDIQWKVLLPTWRRRTGQKQLFNGGLGSSFIALICTDIFLWQRSWDIFRENMFNDYGTAQDKLSEVGMDKSEMVISAVRV